MSDSFSFLTENNDSSEFTFNFDIPEEETKKDDKKDSEEKKDDDKKDTKTKLEEEECKAEFKPLVDLKDIPIVEVKREEDETRVFEQ